MSGGSGPWDVPPKVPPAEGGAPAAPDGVPAAGERPIGFGDEGFDFVPTAGSVPPSDVGASPPTPAPSPPQSGVKAVNCPNCGGTVEIRAAGYTVTVVCQYCSSILDVSTPEVGLIQRYNQAVANLAVPLGSRGWVRGNEYQTVGYMRRSVEGEGWDEYLLFNPYIGYRWLIFDEDGWSFGTMLTSLPAVQGWSAQYAGYSFYNTDEEEWEAVVERVVGEFYWRVERGERAMLANYEGPDVVLSRERVADEITWTVSETMGRGDMYGFGRQDQVGAPPVANALGQNGYADTSSAQARFDEIKTRLDANSPSSGCAPYFMILGGAFFAMVLMMIVFGSMGNSRQAFTYQVSMDGPAESMTFGPLELRQSSQRVEIDTRVVGLDNAYAESDISLVERTTQQSYNASDVVERYTGYDSDGSWSEGSEKHSVEIASVPAGSYDLVVETTVKAWPSPRPDVGRVTVETGVQTGGTFFANLLFALILLFLPLIFLAWRRFKR